MIHWCSYSTQLGPFSSCNKTLLLRPEAVKVNKIFHPKVHNLYRFLTNSKHGYFLIWSCIPDQQWFKISTIKIILVQLLLILPNKKIWTVIYGSLKFFQLWKNAIVLEHMGTVWVERLCESQAFTNVWETLQLFNMGQKNNHCLRHM